MLMHEKTCVTPIFLTSRFFHVFFYHIVWKTYFILIRGPRLQFSNFSVYSSKLPILIKWASSRENLSSGFANNTGADQPGHPRSLISAFVILFLESIISGLATNEILIF